MNFGLPEMLLIIVIALLIFGPRRLPEISRQIGHAMAEYKRATNSLKSKWEAEVRKLDVSLAEPAPSFQSPGGTTDAGLVGADVSEELGIPPSLVCPEPADVEIKNKCASDAQAKDDAGIEVTPSSIDVADSSSLPNCDALLAALKSLSEPGASSAAENPD